MPQPSRRLALKMDDEPELHVIIAPHWKIGAPDIVVKIEVDSAAQIRQVIIKIQKFGLTKAHEGSIQCFDQQPAIIIFTHHAFPAGMQAAGTAADHILHINPLTQFFDLTPDRGYDVGKVHPDGFRQTVGWFVKPVQRAECGQVFRIEMPLNRYEPGSAI